MKKRSAFDRVPTAMRRTEDRARERDLAVCDADRKTVAKRTRNISMFLLVAAVVNGVAGVFLVDAGWWFAIPVAMMFLSVIFFLVGIWYDRYFTPPLVLNDPDAYHAARQAMLRGGKVAVSPLAELAEEHKQRARACWNSITGKDQPC